MNIVMPRTRFDEFSRAYPRTMAIIESLIARAGSDFQPKDADEFSSRMTKEEMTACITEMLAVLAADNGVPTNQAGIVFMRESLQAQGALDKVSEVFSADMLMACRFLINGQKTYYFADNLVARLAATKLTAPADVATLPFRTCLFVFDGPAIYSALSPVFKNNPAPNKPLSVYLHQADKANHIGLGIVASQRGDRPHWVSTYIARSIRLVPGETIEDAMKTEWPDGPQADWRDDAAFVRDGLSLQRIILNAILYLNSAHPDVDPAIRAFGEVPAVGAPRKERRSYEHAVRHQTSLSYIPVGFKTPAIANTAGPGVALADRILVAGHWKQQAHGPGYSLQKAIHVEPYYRGPDMAELVNKPHIVT